MEFNLRKARKLEAKIAATINQKKNELTSTSSDIRVNIDVNNIDTFINNARQNFFDNLKLVNDLTEARQTIRDEISRANFNTGIDDLISNKVLLENKLSYINALNGVEIFDREELEDSLTIYKKQLEQGSRYIGTSTRTNFLSQVDVDKFRADKATLQKEIESIEDKLTEKNYSTKIRLDGTTTKLLQDNNLI